MPVIYGLLACPPCRSVILTAKLVGVDCTLKPINVLGKENNSQEYLKKNPAHSIPTFQEDDGFLIFDSHAIVTYIVSKYGKDDSLYPKDLRARAVVDNMLHFNNSCLWNSILQHFVKVLLSDAAFDEEKEAVYLDRLTTLDTILGERSYAAGDHLTVADICIYNVLTEPDVIGFQFTPYPNVTKWMAKMRKELKFYDEVMVPGIEEMKGYFVKVAEKYKEFIENKKSA